MFFGYIYIYIYNNSYKMLYFNHFFSELKWLVMASKYRNINYGEW
jgi:hypothetical protein